MQNLILQISIREILRELIVPPTFSMYSTSLLQHQLWIKICWFLHHPVHPAQEWISSFCWHYQKSEIRYSGRDSYNKSALQRGIFSVRRILELFIKCIRWIFVFVQTGRLHWLAMLPTNDDNNLNIDTFHLNICCYWHCVKLKLVANQNNAIKSNMTLTQWFPYQMQS